ncbi:MAG: DUF512 domain-containing protein [Candidatus Cloacimonetes bacterium]|nr:DUF512 domain-containing protein [Candidatus Cloacimonadota bacterium]
MPLRVQNVLPRGLAAKSGIRAGERILEVNGSAINDFWDLQYYTSDFDLSLTVLGDDGMIRKVNILRSPGKAVGLEPEPYRFARCHNHCLFCFIDQMPPALREDLYAKDDDYLFSYVFGNYISMTNLTSAEYQRVIDQRISPLYISVHAADPLLRSRLMGYRKEFDIIEKLKWLSEYGIRFHTQVVVVPGWNDGEALTDTILALIQPDLNVLSVGIVPVGLTRHRQHLLPIDLVTADVAERTLDQVDTIKSRLEIHNIYCADELYILAGRAIPESAYYDDFCQIENGIGMMRMMLENFKGKKRTLIKELRKKGKDMVLITGVSAAGAINDLARYIQAKLDPLKVRVSVVQNDFMGRTVTVSGLLTYADIIAQAEVRPDEIALLPGNIFNYEGITLDGYSQIDLKHQWKSDIVLVDYLFEDWDWL